jgi:hypothetical protein
MSAPGKKTYFILLIPIMVVALLITSCGVVELDNGCVLIKKQSREKIDLGRAFLEMADQGKVGDGLSVSDVQAEGYKYMIEGLRLTVDNPQCFTESEVSVAKRLLGQ